MSLQVYLLHTVCSVDRNTKQLLLTEIDLPSSLQMVLVDVDVHTLHGSQNSNQNQKLYSVADERGESTTQNN